MLRDKINSGIVSLLSDYAEKITSRPLNFEGFVEKWTGFLLTKICEERGCKPSKIETGKSERKTFLTPLGSAHQYMEKVTIAGPCVWCGREEK